MTRRRPASAEPLHFAPAHRADAGAPRLSAPTSSSGTTSPASPMVSGRAPRGAADHGDAVRHRVERRARGMASIQRGRGARGHDEHVEPRPDLVDRARGRAPSQVTRPAMPSRSASPSSSSWAGPVPTTVMRPPAHQLHGGAEQEVEPLLGDQPADEADARVRMGRRGRPRAAAATPSCGIVRCGSDGWPSQRQPAGELVDRDHAGRAGERAVAAQPGQRAPADRQALAGQEHVRELEPAGQRARSRRRRCSTAPLRSGPARAGSRSAGRGRVPPCQNGSAAGSALPRIGTGTVRTPPSSPQLVCCCCARPAGTQRSGTAAATVAPRPARARSLPRAAGSA